MGDRCPVADVVRSPREDVDRHEISALTRWQQPQGHGEVLVGGLRRDDGVRRSGPVLSRASLGYACPLTCHVPIRSRFLMGMQTMTSASPDVRVAFLMLTFANLNDAFSWTEMSVIGRSCFLIPWGRCGSEAPRGLVSPT